MTPAVIPIKTPQNHLRQPPLAVLRQYLTPEKLSRAQTGKLAEVLQTASNGRFGEWKARQLKELARDSFGIPDCEGAYSALLLLSRV